MDIKELLDQYIAEAQQAKATAEQIARYMTALIVSNDGDGFVISHADLEAAVGQSIVIEGTAEGVTIAISVGPGA